MGEELSDLVNESKRLDNEMVFLNFKIHNIIWAYLR